MNHRPQVVHVLDVPAIRLPLLALDGDGLVVVTSGGIVGGGHRRAAFRIDRQRKLVRIDHALRARPDKLPPQEVELRVRVPSGFDAGELRRLVAALC